MPQTLVIWNLKTFNFYIARLLQKKLLWFFCKIKGSFTNELNFCLDFQRPKQKLSVLIGNFSFIEFHLITPFGTRDLSVTFQNISTWQYINEVMLPSMQRNGSMKKLSLMLPNKFIEQNMQEQRETEVWKMWKVPIHITSYLQH